ncbi:MAG TPA: hypothetical protein VGU73_08395 [Acidimicrobiia bacterium]|nr:hypothetical protein [Acidimicrobiia bacterium]
MTRLLASAAAATGLVVVLFGSPASASSTIAANSSVVTKTVKNVFLVHPSSPNASQVSCPSKQVKAFDRFTCTAVVDGLKVPVAVQVLDTVPLTVNATPQKAVLSLDRSEGALEGRYYERTGIAVSAVCPGGSRSRYVLVTPGTTITCQLIGASGPVATGTVTATDFGGGYASGVLPSVARTG